MGASIFLIFIIPVLIFEILFGTFVRTQTEEIILPYDPGKGMVWEYDGVDDPYIKLIETKTNGENQIFVFENTGISKADKKLYQGKIMELVFADKNGNERIFYAHCNGGNYPPHIYPAEECKALDFSVKAAQPTENGAWKSVSYGTDYLVCQKISETSAEDFTIVITPYYEEIVGSSFNISLSYVSNPNSFFEKEIEKRTLMFSNADAGLVYKEV